MLFELGDVNGSLARGRDEDRAFFWWGNFNQVADGDLSKSRRRERETSGRS
jgi:hypothetical protein